jgi:hypothetical protein
MSTVTFDQFFPEVLPYVRDCPEFVAINAIRNACIEFCDKSLYWREVLNPITLVVGQSTYPLDPVSNGATVAQIVSASIGISSLMSGNEEKLSQTIGADWRSRIGPVAYFVQDDLDNVVLAQVPDGSQSDPLIITAAIRPERTATKVDKELFDRYAEIIGFGARARLHDTPGQPYSDDTAAKKFRMWFESGYGEAKIAANRARGRGPLMVRPPRI